MQLRTQIKLTLGLIPGVGFLCAMGNGCGVPIVPPRGIRPFDGRFWQRWRRPGPACGPRRRFCAHLFTVLEFGPSSAQHSVIGLPVEMTQSAVPRGLAELQAMRRMIATEVHRRLVADCNGHGKRQALAGGRYWQVAGIGGALGQASLRKGQAVEGRSCDAVARAGIPAQGQVRQRAARCSRGAFPNGALRGFSDAWRAYLAKISCI